MLSGFKLFYIFEISRVKNASRALFESFQNKENNLKNLGRNDVDFVGVLVVEGDS